MATNPNMDALYVVRQFLKANGYGQCDTSFIEQSTISKVRATTSYGTELNLHMAQRTSSRQRLVLSIDLWRELVDANAPVTSFTELDVDFRNSTIVAAPNGVSAPSQLLISDYATILRDYHLAGWPVMRSGRNTENRKGMFTEQWTPFTDSNWFRLRPLSIRRINQQNQMVQEDGRLPQAVRLAFDKCTARAGELDMLGKLRGAGSPQTIGLIHGNPRPDQISIDENGRPQFVDALQASMDMVETDFVPLAFDIRVLGRNANLWPAFQQSYGQAHLGGTSSGYPITVTVPEIDDLTPYIGNLYIETLGQILTSPAATQESILHAGELIVAHANGDSLPRAGVLPELFPELSQGRSGWRPDFFYVEATEREALQRERLEVNPLHFVTTTSGNGVTFPTGFRASAVDAHFRNPHRIDFALVVNDGPNPTSSAVVTKHIFAAPSITDLKRKQHNIRAIAINSGNGNACAGAPGANAHALAVGLIADALDMDSGHVAVLSTGKIGTPLEVRQYGASVPSLVEHLDSSPSAGLDAADATRTTDSIAKTVEVASARFNVAGMAKGSGMVTPGLATMIVTLTTDAMVEQDLLDRVTKKASDAFNAIRADGCTSTNDSLTIMASGANGYRPSEEELTKAVTLAAESLARQILHDLETSTMRLEQQGGIPEVVPNGPLPRTASITVEGSTSPWRVADEITKADLFRADLAFGPVIDPGSFVAVVGSACTEHAPDVNPDDVEIRIDGALVFQNQTVIGPPPERFHGELDIQIKLGPEEFSATRLTTGKMLQLVDFPGFPQRRDRPRPIRSDIRHRTDHIKLLPPEVTELARASTIERLYLIFRGTDKNGFVHIPASSYANDIPITLLIPHDASVRGVITDCNRVDVAKVRRFDDNLVHALSAHPFATRAGSSGMTGDLRNAAQEHALRNRRRTRHIMIADSHFDITDDVQRRISKGLEFTPVSACTRTGDEDHSAVGLLDDTSEFAGMGCIGINLQEVVLLSPPNAFSGDWAAIQPVIRDRLLTPAGSVQARDDIWPKQHFEPAQPSAMEHFDALFEAMIAREHQPDVPPLSNPAYFHAYLASRAQNLSVHIERNMYDHDGDPDERAAAIATASTALRRLDSFSPELAADYLLAYEAARDSWTNSIRTPFGQANYSYDFEAVPVHSFANDGALFPADGLQRLPRTPFD